MDADLKEWQEDKKFFKEYFDNLKNRLGTCIYCRGTGKYSGMICCACEGLGKVVFIEPREEPCTICSGTGIRFNSWGDEIECKRCQGKGRVTVKCREITDSELKIYEIMNKS
jgi:hypothetical protein